tara:strand:- start:4855 stop:5340 length:486 start_codon:yes stop_codon:yes gene_type:complete
MGATTLYNFRTKVLDWTPGIAAAGHVANDVVAAFEEVALNEGGTATRPLRGTINYAIIHDADEQSKQFDILISDSSTVAMGAAEGSAVAMTDANAATILGVIDTGATYIDVGGSTLAKPAAFSPIPFELSGDSLYIGIVTRASWTPTDVDKIVVRFGLTIE